MIPGVFPLRRRAPWHVPIWWVLAVLLPACSEPTSPPSPFAYQVRGAVADPYLGELSPIALTIAAGTEDTEVRQMLRDSVATAYQMGGGYLLDLRRCGAGTVIARVFAAGASRVGGSAEAACAFLSRPEYASGVALYVDRDMFLEWSGGTLPTVSAIADVNMARPAAGFTGYVGAVRRVRLPSEGPLPVDVPGPVFVIQPFIFLGGAG